MAGRKKDTARRPATPWLEYVTTRDKRKVRNLCYNPKHPKAKRERIKAGDKADYAPQVSCDNEVALERIAEGADNDRAANRMLKSNAMTYSGEGHYIRGTDVWETPYYPRSDAGDLYVAAAQNFGGAPLHDLVTKSLVTSSNKFSTMKRSDIGLRSMEDMDPNGDKIKEILTTALDNPRIIDKTVEYIALNGGMYSSDFFKNYNDDEYDRQVIAEQVSADLITYALQNENCTLYAATAAAGSRLALEGYLKPVEGGELTNSDFDFTDNEKFVHDAAEEQLDIINDLSDDELEVQAKAFADHSRSNEIFSMLSGKMPERTREKVLEKIIDKYGEAYDDGKRTEGIFRKRYGPITTRVI